MAKEGRDLVKEAVQDAKSLKEAAIEAAKNQLIEGMTPAIRSLVEKSLKGALGSKNEDTDRIRRGVQDKWPGESHTGFEEAKERGETKMDVADKKAPAVPGEEQELDLESLIGFFPQLAEMPDENAIPTLGEMDLDPAADPLKKDEPVAEAAEEDDAMKAEAKKKDDKEKDKMDEEIEISESELKKVYESALQVEVQVKKGFSDMTPSGELEDVVKDADKGLADVKKGEHTWEKETPPAKQDFTVKEMIQRGLAENKALRAENAKLTKMVEALGSKLHEVNLFNAKVLHVNRIFNSNGRLTKEQKTVVLESLDKAKSIDEVKMVYETICSSFKASQALSEGKNPRKPTANAQRARTSGAPDQKVLSESVDRANGTSTFERFKVLAGLVK